MVSPDMFVLDQERLASLGAERRGAYASAEPFPHAVIDDFLPAEVLREVAESFPKPGEVDWHVFDNPRQKKLAFDDERRIGPSALRLLYQLNSGRFVEFLERLTGIEGLIPDPHFVGGGLHQIERGGFLKIHADFNRHPRLRLDRRLNLLLFLNENWEEEYGGHLEFWDAGMTRCARRVLPVFNRCVIFNTTDTSFHGHPEPLACPQGRTRKSLALYYYSNGRPEEEASADHGTLVRPRPGEVIHGLNGRVAAESFRHFLRRLVPPILTDVGARLRRKP
jgi:Rps23 Pro-64 3,4-dihydroxylase Tpa1-like proline 4-hydroxylase